MKTIKLSRTAYFTAAAIVFLYMLAFIFQSYALNIFPTYDGKTISYFIQGETPEVIISSYIMIGCCFAILYPFLVICMHNFEMAPVASITAFLCIFFYCSVEICLRTVSLLYTQLELPPAYHTMNGPDVQTNLLLKFRDFQDFKIYFDLPLTIAQIIFSTILLFTLSNQQKANRLLQCAFVLNILCLIIHGLNFHSNKYEMIHHHGTDYLIPGLIIQGLMLIWFILIPLRRPANGISKQSIISRIAK